MVPFEYLSLQADEQESGEILPVGLELETSASLHVGPVQVRLTKNQSSVEDVI